MVMCKCFDFLSRQVCWFVDYNDTAILHEIIRKLVLIEMSVQTGAPVNCFAAAYLTPLHVAVERGHLEVKICSCASDSGIFYNPSAHLIIRKYFLGSWDSCQSWSKHWGQRSLRPQVFVICPISVSIVTDVLWITLIVTVLFTSLLRLEIFPQ